MPAAVAPATNRKGGGPMPAASSLLLPRERNPWHAFMESRPPYLLAHPYTARRVAYPQATCQFALPQPVARPQRFVKQRKLPTEHRSRVLGQFVPKANQRRAFDVSTYGLDELALLGPLSRLKQSFPTGIARRHRYRPPCRRGSWPWPKRNRLSGRQFPPARKCGRKACWKAALPNATRRPEWFWRAPWSG